MKQTLILVSAIFLFFGLTAEAQLNFNPFLAKDGYSVAVKKAEELGFTNPSLIIVGSTTGDYQVGTFKINLKFDLDSGKATLWAFMFVSTNKPDSIKGIAIISSPFPLGDKFLAVEITPEQLKNFPVPGKTPISTDKWINSDAMMNALNKDVNYNSFKSSCDSMRVKMIGLGIYSDYPLPDKTRPYWSGLFGNDKTEHYFFVDAQTGEVVDPKTMGIVADNSENNNLSVYPNPTSEMITINPNIENLNDFSLILFDRYGNIIDENKFSKSVMNDMIVLKCDGVSSGLYSYKLNIGENLQYGTFFIIK